LFRGLKADGDDIPDGGIAPDDNNEARADGGKPDEDSNEENPREGIPDGDTSNGDSADCANIDERADCGNSDGDRPPLNGTIKEVNIFKYRQ